MAKFAPHKTRKLIVSGKLTFDERFVIHRVDHRLEGRDLDLGEVAVGGRVEGLQALPDLRHNLLNMW